MASKNVSYECFDELAASLRNDGLSDEADRLHVLLHEVAWTTGSEMLGELGQELKRIERKDHLRDHPNLSRRLKNVSGWFFAYGQDFRDRMQNNRIEIGAGYPGPLSQHLACGSALGVSSLRSKLAPDC